jgi:hypothetical protein
MTPDPDLPRGSRYQLSVEMPLPHAPGWHLAGTFIAGGGRLTLAALHLLPGHNRETRRAGDWDPCQDALAPGVPDIIETCPLTKELLNELPLAKLARLANHSYTGLRSTQLDRRLRPRLQTAPVHPGKAIPDRDYLPFAQGYAELIGQGQGRYREQLALEFHLTTSQVRERIRECRKRDLLTPGTRGRATGALTPKAQQMLDAAEQAHTQERK